MYPATSSFGISPRPDLRLAHQSRSRTAFHPELVGSYLTKLGTRSFVDIGHKQAGFPPTLAIRNDFANEFGADQRVGPSLAGIGDGLVGSPVNMAAQRLIARTNGDDDTSIGTAPMSFDRRFDLTSQMGSVERESEEEKKQLTVQTIYLHG